MSRETAMVRMSAIEERRELNPRGQLTQEVIQEYVRRQMNGEKPPPIQVHRRTNVIFDGAHRFHAYKAVFGDGWKDAEIEVEWRDDIPDPDEEPEMFRLQAAVENRVHGLRLSRLEKKQVLADLLQKRGLELVKQYAAKVNETPESVEELLAVFSRPYESLSNTVRESSDSMNEVSKSPKAAPNDQESTLIRDTSEQVITPPQIGNSRYRPESFPTGQLRQVRPVIKVACDKLKLALSMYAHSLTESERVALLELYGRLGEVLHGQAAD